MRNIIYTFITLCLTSCSSSQTLQPSNFDKCNAKLEKGIFLYEINVPQRYYLRGDAIVSAQHIIKFPKNKKELLESYRNGIYYDGKSTDQIMKLIREFKKDSCYDNSVVEFSRASGYFDRDYYFKHKYDNYYWIGNMAFVKFYAEFYVVDVGKIDEMIPKLEDYKCCYSNTQEQIDGKLIIKVKEFKILPPTDSDAPSIR